jgi:2-oxoisovalerate dehydrogenase E2 component (dihydrolipoyl transacylase)
VREASQLPLLWTAGSFREAKEAGADAVQQVEKTRREGGRVTLLEPVRPGQNIAPRGHDVEDGARVLRRGQLLRPPEIGVLAAIGRTRVRVYAKPRVGVAATGDELVPLTQMRKAIANAMVLSKTTIPHAAAMMEVDWTNVARLRDKLKEDFRAREGFELTYLPFAMKAACLALRDHPLVNAAWTDRGVLRLKAINMGVAIALGDEGLVVPVLKNADALSIAGLAKGVHDLATRARAKKLTLQDFEGGTFTINNGGTFGTYLSYPIVNPPQAAIMTTEAIGKRVVVLEGDLIAIRMMGNLVISFDHRVMDGATAARFLKQVKDWIEAASDGVPVY